MTLNNLTEKEKECIEWVRKDAEFWLNNMGSMERPERILEIIDTAIRLDTVLTGAKAHDDSLTEDVLDLTGKLLASDMQVKALTAKLEKVAWLVQIMKENYLNLVDAIKEASMSVRCYQCASLIHPEDDDAYVCINCGGRNRRRKKIYYETLLGGPMSGLQMKYFVLNPTKDDKYGSASRKAVEAYSKAIEKENPMLAVDLREWMAKCKRDIFLKKEAP